MNAKDTLERAGRILLDEDYTRWTLTELVEWLNDALREIALQKPSATAKNLVIDLVEGTLQTLPEKYNQFLRVIRNVDIVDGKRVGATVVTTCQRSVLDAQQPNWHSNKYVRFRPYARHFVFDETDPLTFYVYPGNDGTGHIEAVVSAIPDPVVATGESDAMASYNEPVDISDVYANAVLDYMLYRAYCKDAQNAGAVARATMYYGQFATSIGIKTNVESRTSPNVKATGATAG